MSDKLRSHAAPATILLAAALALIVVGLLTLSGAEAADKQPSCGDTITVDTTLDSDLLDCPNNGIVIGADDVTLDLNGHTISGDGEAFEQCPRREFCDFGVLNVGHDGVSVKKGSVRDFFNAGVLIGGVRDNRVIDVSSKGNGFFGFVVSESSRSLIRDSSGSRNPAPDGDGLGIFASHDIRVVDNSFKHNAQPGIHVAFGSNDNVIEGNLISDSGPGISIEEADRNRVRRNRFVGNSAGVIVAPGSRQRDRPQPPLRRRRRHRDREGTRQRGQAQSRRWRSRGRASTSGSTRLRSAGLTTSFAEMRSGEVATMGSTSEGRTTTASSSATSPRAPGTTASTSRAGPRSW